VVVAPGEPANKSEYVRTLFTRIAHRYDLMNALMTGGRHHAWRRMTADTLRSAPAGPVLDLATGTGDLALAIRRTRPADAVVGADFSEGMLREAAAKLRRRGERRVALVAADALALPFRDRTFAAVTSAFLLRNLADLSRGIAEMRRVTRPGGLVVTLEITRPRIPGWDGLFGFYFHRIVPVVGSVVAGDRAAYAYLPDSVDHFVSPQGLADLMRRTGLGDVHYRRLGLGTIALHVGVA
jgi:demethylmenaquinone methyltransferase / 2-methoxy-6-polyprenyl-1,4-benzoquinol methylase